MSEVLLKITTRAKAIRKTKPAIKWTDAIKQAAAELRGKKTVSRSAPKKAAPKKRAVSGVKKAVAAPKKIKVVVRKTKAGNTTLKIGAAKSQAQPSAELRDFARKKGITATRGYDARNRTITGISTEKINQEAKHIESLEKIVKTLSDQAKSRALTATEKNVIKRDIVKYKNAISASKTHIQALKKSI
jgi:hypothetical protein